MHFAHFYTEGIQHKTDFFAVEDLHPVEGGIDEDKHVSVAKVHPHPVRDDAAQTIEPQAHVYGTVVEPVPMAVVNAEHC